MPVATVATSITDAVTTLTGVATSIFTFITANEWLVICFAAGIIIPLAFGFLGKSKRFAKR